MNFSCESVGAAAIQILRRMIDRPRAAKPRRFRPLAEPMETRAVLSHVAIAPAMAGPAASGRGPSAIVDGQGLSSDAMVVPSGPGIGDMVIVNGQVENQPGDVVWS
jgi:hypothetical protein